MNDLNKKVAELIINNPFLLIVLERFEVYLGLQDKTIKDICIEHKINPNLFLIICNLHENENEIRELHLKAEDINTLLKYLSNSHNYYKTEVIPKISKKIKKISSINKNDLTYILLERFFEEYKQEVFKHLEYEEKIVFPYVSAVINHNSKQLDYSISEYKNHHDDIEAKLLELKNLLIKHLPYKNDQKSRRDLLLNIFHFEKDLRIHTIIEEDILVHAIKNLENKNS